MYQEQIYPRNLSVSVISSIDIANKLYTHTGISSSEVNTNLYGHCHFLLKYTVINLINNLNWKMSFLLFTRLGYYMIFI